MTGTVGNEGSLRSEGCHRAVRVVERGVAGGGTLGSPHPDPIRMRRGAWSPSTSPAWSLDMPTLPPPPRHPRPPSVQGDKPDDCTLKVWCRAGLPMRRPLITWWGALSGEEVGWNRAGGGANEAGPASGGLLEPQGWTQPRGHVTPSLPPGTIASRNPSLTLPGFFSPSALLHSHPKRFEPVEDRVNCEPLPRPPLSHEPSPPRQVVLGSLWSLCGTCTYV